jgi:type I restriction enzyme M protein
MNLLLHGIQDFQIVNADTLKTPAFTDNGKLQQFDLILANPPYSISQWDRTAFESDKYGRNFLGTPPQGRADYAFFQHILKSLDEKTGRCAILFPHGVLFRNEEKDMREKLIRMDLVECVIGLGANLFYNSPMEACIIICRTKKENSRKGQVLFINAVNEVTRKNAQSFLEDKHIKRIAQAYEKYESDNDIAKKATIKDIEKNDFSLSIPLYIQTTKEEEVDDRTVQECYNDWKSSAGRAIQYQNMILEMIGGTRDDN